MQILSNKKYLYFIGTYIFFVVFVMFSAVDFGAGMAISKILMSLMFGLFLLVKTEEHKMDFEKSVIAVVVLLFNSLMLLRGKMQGYSEIINIICSIFSIMVSVRYLIYNHNGVNIRKWFLDNRLILLIILCFSILSIEVIDSWLMWDAWQYYVSGILQWNQDFNADLSGVYSLYLASHASVGYTLWIILFQLLSAGIESVQVADIVLAAISIFAYYQILRKLLGDRYSDKVLAMASIPYACSPFVLGIIGNVNLDSATMYFAVIFIACVLYRYECLELIFAFLFCFTKEPAVIYYVVYILTKIVCEYLSENKIHIGGLIKVGFGNIKNYIYALPAILWIFLYKFNSGMGWGSESVSGWNDEGWNCFGISGYTMPIRLKHIFYLNFNWIFWLAIILGIIFIFIKKIKIEKKLFKFLIPICVMGLSVMVFGCVYITFLLPRYIVPVIPVLYLTATAVVTHFNKKVLYVFTIAISCLLFIQNFSVIDPIMAAKFPAISIGYKSYSVMYKMGNEDSFEDRFDDHIVYNRQNIYWSEAVAEVLGRAGYNGDMLIALPNEDPSPQYDLLGNAVCLWNTKTKKLEYCIEGIEIPQDSRIVQACRVQDVVDNMGMAETSRILYIVPKWADIDWDFISSKKVLKQGTVEHKGYCVEYMVLEPDCTLLDNGNYLVLPKQESSIGLYTDGVNLLLGRESVPLRLLSANTRYEFLFDEYQVAMDVQYGRVNDNGTVWVWESTGADSQRWFLEKVEDYYMICWYGYALTYDLNDNSIRLTPKTGEDNQLWSFIN